MAFHHVQSFKSVILVFNRAGGGEFTFWYLVREYTQLVRDIGVVWQGYQGGGSTVLVCI